MSQCDGPSTPECLASDRSTVPSPQQTLLKTICEVPPSARAFLAYIHMKRLEESHYSPTESQLGTGHLQDGAQCVDHRAGDVQLALHPDGQTSPRNAGHK